jgi:phospholipid/cholesterol/gamma-HCH transport system ATP-binding protein
MINTKPVHTPVIEVQSLVTAFGSSRVHDGISFSISAGSIVALIGGSGTGKSTLLRELLALHRPTEGVTKLFGVDLTNCSPAEAWSTRRRFGVTFQSGALFSSLTCGENIATPLREQLGIKGPVLEEIVQLKLGLVGLEPQVASKMPNELSGGMVKRVALARALSTEPELLFLDEPTSGLDPISARAFDALIATLHRSLGITIFIVTHDLDSLFSIDPRVIALGEGKILADGPIAEVARHPHPWIQKYFSSRYHHE